MVGRPGDIRVLVSPGPRRGDPPVVAWVEEHGPSVAGWQRAWLRWAFREPSRPLTLRGRGRPVWRPGGHHPATGLVGVRTGTALFAYRYGPVLGGALADAAGVNAWAAPGEVRRRLARFLLVGGPYRPHHPDRTGLVPPAPAPPVHDPDLIPVSPGRGRTSLTAVESQFEADRVMKMNRARWLNGASVTPKRASLNRRLPLLAPLEAEFRGGPLNEEVWEVHEFPGHLLFEEDPEHDIATLLGRRAAFRSETRFHRYRLAQLTYGRAVYRWEWQAYQVQVGRGDHWFFRPPPRIRPAVPEAQVW